VFEMSFKIFPEEGGHAHAVAQHDGKTSTDRLVVNLGTVKTLSMAFPQADQLRQGT
jgi:hypothetical protein